MFLYHLDILSSPITLYYHGKEKIFSGKIRRRGKTKFNIDFSIDDVDYADILPSDTEPKNNEC